MSTLFSQCSPGKPKGWTLIQWRSTDCICNFNGYALYSGWITVTIKNLFPMLHYNIYLDNYLDKYRNKYSSLYKIQEA